MPEFTTENFPTLPENKVVVKVQPVVEPVTMVAPEVTLDSIGPPPGLVLSNIPSELSVPLGFRLANPSDIMGDVSHLVAGVESILNDF